MNEQWAEIAGFEGRYEVSDAGRIRSVSRSVTSIGKSSKPYLRTIKSKILASHTWGAPYPGVVLLSEDGKKVRRSVHQLVAVAFLDNPNGYHEVNHIDGNKDNAAASNLEWCDHPHNLRHAYRSGIRPVGHNHHFSKLPRDERGFCIETPVSHRVSETSHIGAANAGS